MNLILLQNLRLFASDIIQELQYLQFSFLLILQRKSKFLKSRVTVFRPPDLISYPRNFILALNFLKSDSYWIFSSPKNYWMSLPRPYTTSDLMQLIQQTCICRNSIVGVTNQLINEVTYQHFWLDFLNIHRVKFKLPFRYVSTGYVFLCNPFYITAFSRIWTSSIRYRLYRINYLIKLASKRIQLM